MKKFLTLDDLYGFYLNQNQNCTFSSKNTDSTIVVHVNETITFSDEPSSDEYDPNYGLLKTHLKSCHILQNRNSSYISEESMKQAIPSFYNRPILGYIHQLANGEYDFAGHEMSVGENGQMEYQEIPVGNIPESCNAQLVYDEEKDKTYLEVDGYIYEEYTKAADILRRKGESKVSVELGIDELSYNAKDKVLNIEKFHFMGVTILGTSVDGKERAIEEGMYGSNIKLADFSEKNNSVFSQNNTKLIEMLEQLNNKIDNLSNLTINNNLEEGGKLVTKFEELLKQYNVTVDDIEFDYSEMTDEDLEAKFAEVFGETDTEGEGKNSIEDLTEGDDSGKGENPEDKASEGENNDSEPENFQKTFSISHEDIKASLYSLLSPFEEADGDWYYISAVYDDYFAYEGWCTDSIYGQKYTKDGDNIALDGERYALHRELLTDSEYTELQTMRSNYASISEKLEAYEKKETDSLKEAVFEKESYSKYLECEEFVSLKNDMDNYSVEELTEKAELAFAKCVQKLGFSLEEKPVEKKACKRVATITSYSEESKSTYKPYGDLFDEE